MCETYFNNDFLTDILCTRFLIVKKYTNNYFTPFKRNYSLVITMSN
jgi:hypothetical protein